MRTSARLTTRTAAQQMTPLQALALGPAPAHVGVEVGRREAAGLPPLVQAGGGLRVTPPLVRQRQAQASLRCCWRPSLAVLARPVAANDQRLSLGLEKLL
jgi:hypothetical protein